MVALGTVLASCIAREGRWVYDFTRHIRQRVAGRSCLDGCLDTYGAYDPFLVQYRPFEVGPYHVHFVFVFVFRPFRAVILYALYYYELFPTIDSHTNPLAPKC